MNTPSTSALENAAVARNASQRAAQHRTGSATTTTSATGAGHNTGAKKNASASGEQQSFAQVLKGKTQSSATLDGKKVDRSVDLNADTTRRASGAKAEGQSGEKDGTSTNEAESQHAKAKSSKDASTDDTQAGTAAQQTLHHAPSTMALAKGGADKSLGKGGADKGKGGAEAVGSGRGAKGLQAGAAEDGAATQAANGKLATGEGNDFAKALAAAQGDNGNPLGGMQAVNSTPVMLESSVSGGQGEQGLASLGALSQQPAPQAAGQDALLNNPLPSARADVPVPLTSPQFPVAMGMQLNTWLAEGVQHATLELHPQELGPIDVHIALRDGKAHIDLNSAVAATREVLGASLQQLATQLGDVGVSLSSTSVSDQAARQQAQDGQAGQNGQTGQGGSGATGVSRLALGSAEDGDANLSGPVPRAIRPRGLVDTYA
jgi:flagellar hook-length control protein FliK